MTEYVLMDLATKTEALTQKLEDIQDILSRILDGEDQVLDLMEDIKNHLSDR